MAHFITVREGAHPLLHFEDGAEQIQLNGLIGMQAIAELDLLPTSAIAENRRKLTSDVFWVNTRATGRAAVVSAAFKEAVEAVEPDVHQFFAVTVKDQDGNPYPGPHHILQVRRNLPCVLFQLCRNPRQGAVRAGPNMGRPYYLCDDDECVLSKPAIRGHHLFSSTVVAPGCCFVSDELMAELESRKIKGLRTHPAREVDGIWDPKDVVPDFLDWMNADPERASQNAKFLEGVRG